jgi:nitrogen fixation protein FixH
MPILSGPITGRKAFAIFAAPFAVVIAVNVTLAVQAVRTFPGLETDNSYVASQVFDAERAAQARLGWRLDATLAPGAVSLRVLGPDGRPVEGARVAAEIGRPTTRDRDQPLALALADGVWRAPAALPPGLWELRVTATAADGTPFRQVLELRL